MAEKPAPYSRKNPGDVLHASDWNEIQIEAREEIQAHRHSGGDDGSPIPRAGIEAGAIDGRLIDPAAEVNVRSLTTSGNLTVRGELAVNGKALLGDIADLLATVKGLQAAKVARAGDTMSGSLNIQRDLLVDGRVGIGTTTPAQRLVIRGDHNDGRDPDSGLSYGGQLAIKGNAPQLDFIDTDNTDWAIRVDGDQMHFIREPWSYTSLVLAARGFVGIGTATPAQMLTIQANHDVGGDPDSGLRHCGQLAIKGNVCQLDFIDTDHDDWAITVTDNKMHFIRQPWNSTDLVLDGTGKVGIGTASPSEKLEVVGNLKVSGTILAANGFLGIGTTTPAQKLTIQGVHGDGRDPDSGLRYGGQLAIKGNVSQLDFISTEHDDWAIMVNSNKMHFVRQPWNYSNFVLDGTGKVGIGIDNPPQQLTITGGLGFANQNALDKKLYSPDDGVLEWMTHQSAREHGFAVSHQGEKRVYLNTNGDSYLVGGNVGIGTRGPHGTLTVNGTANVTDGSSFAVHSGCMASGSLTVGSIVANYGGGRGWNANTAGLMLETLANTEIAVQHTHSHLASLMYYEGDEANRITIGRDMGWGVTPLVVAGNLDVSGRITGNLDRLVSPNGEYRLEMQHDRNLVIYDNANRAVWNTRTALSDLTLKEDLAPIDGALQKLLSLRGVSFAWKDKTLGDGRELGVIAQEVEAVFPELVTTLTERKFVNTDGLVPVLIEAIREQQAQIDELRKAVEAQPRRRSR